MMEKLSVEVVVKYGSIEVKNNVSIEVLHGLVSQELFDRLLHLASKLAYGAVCAEM